MPASAVTNESGSSLPATGVVSRLNARPALSGSDWRAGLAQSTGNQPKGFSPWRSFGALVVVLAALFGINVYLRRKRLGMGRADKNKRLTVLDRFVLDHKHSVLLIDADGQRILVGLTPDRIVSLARLDGEDGDVPGGTSFEAAVKREETRQSGDNI